MINKLIVEVVYKNLAIFKKYLTDHWEDFQVHFWKNGDPEERTELILYSFRMVTSGLRPVFVSEWCNYASTEIFIT